MDDEYDEVIVQAMLEDALKQMQNKKEGFGDDLVKAVKGLAKCADVNLPPPPPPAPPAVSVTPPLPDGASPLQQSLAPEHGTSPGEDKKTISARACVVCGRDDRPGLQRSKGFKCHECVGMPSRNKFKVEVDEFAQLQRSIDEHGNKVINDFEFGKALGKGSFGKVKKAVHAKSGQAYAVKILNKQSLMKVHSGATNAMDKVHTEIKIMKALSHPNIIKIYAVIDDPDESKLYLVMEFLPGGQIFHVNPDGTGGQDPIPKEQLKKYIVGIAQGLQYLHSKNIVHRDIKPENILLDANDNVKLADFGVSSTCDSGTDVMTNTEGSPAFLPPEEFQGKPVSGRAQDVWAFGVTLYAMAFGRLPFCATSLGELENKVCNEEPSYPHGSDPYLVHLLSGMMRKDASLRIGIPGILEHPFVSDVRCVKGFPVETVTCSIAVAKSADEEKDAQVVLLESSEHSKGSEDLLSFVKDEGPNFQIVRGGTYSTTLYSIKSDPRRKLLLRGNY